ncbi:MAG: MBL fold metallo-hydrolase [Gammaproteobacteria bacterium]|jgi:phosphoribosyl 1,2-cyclic phosphodiesterase|nr:MBL fold metallo-hydrolase [Gammaproteobacteria bacterium]
MRFATLGSGSRGNALLVAAGATRLLVDCGFGLRETERRLAQFGVGAAYLQGILVTHEHSDHLRGVAALARRHGIPVWATTGTWSRSPGAGVERLHLIASTGPGFQVGDIRVEPFPIPHDAREPCHYVLESGGRRLGLLTDSGHVTRHIRHRLSECDALVLECNHDAEMLRHGPYPPFLRARVGGDFGHLGNHQAAELVDQLPHRHLTRLLLAHLSEKNNHPDLARQAILAVDASLAARLTLAHQDQPSPWLAV